MQFSQQRPAIIAHPSAAHTLVGLGAAVAGLAIVANCAALALRDDASVRTSDTSTLSDADLAKIPNAFPSDIQPPSDTRFAAIYNGLRERAPLDAMGQFASKLIRLPNVRVEMIAKQCGAPDAHYDRRKRRITLCFETLVAANRFIGREGARMYAYDPMIPTMIVLHEIAHALTDVLQLPVTGSREDLADQFAVLVLTNGRPDPNVTEALASSAMFFFQYGELVDRYGGQDADDVHSSGQQRAFDMICLIYGRTGDQRIVRALKNAVTHCPQRAREVAATWNALLAPHTRVADGAIF